MISLVCSFISLHQFLPVRFVSPAASDSFSSVLKHLNVSETETSCRHDEDKDKEKDKDKDEDEDKDMGFSQDVTVQSCRPVRRSYNMLTVQTSHQGK